MTPLNPLYMEIINAARFLAKRDTTEDRLAALRLLTAAVNLYPEVKNTIAYIDAAVTLGPYFLSNSYGADPHYKDYNAVIDEVTDAMYEYRAEVDRLQAAWLHDCMENNKEEEQQ